MELHTYIAYTLAGVALLAAIRLHWSTSGLQLAAYRKTLQEGQRHADKLAEDMQLVVEARELLRKANYALQQALKEKDAEISSQANEIRALKKNLYNQRAANDLLNDTIGNQQLMISKLNLDVSMLKDEVLKMRAQLGLQP